MNTLIKIAEYLTNNEIDQQIIRYYYKLILLNPKIIGKFETQIQVYIRYISGVQLIFFLIFYFKIIIYR